MNRVVVKSAGILAVERAALPTLSATDILVKVRCLPVPSSSRNPS